jgi:aldose sugar dehydrogenase
VNWPAGRSFPKAKIISSSRLAERVRVIVLRPGRWMKGLLLALGFVGVALIGVAGGILLQSKHLPHRAISVLRSHLLQTLPLTQVITWRDVNTNLHVIQVGIAKISGVKIYGGSLAEVGGNILIASPQGQLSYMDARYQLHSLELRVPMNMEGLRKDPLYKQPLFNVAFVRTDALLAIQTGADTYDLYATFNRFAGNCFQFVVGRISLEANDKIVRPTSDWHDVWIANPCVPLKDRGYLFVGVESGGRMVRLTDDTILVAVGDHQMDGFYDSRAVAMDPTNDLGKLIEVNIKTGASHHFAIGLRNPEGLTIARDGRIWETENGPQGGDEVNLMIEGKNYGWPIVTYGMAYGYPPKKWPFDPRPGGHDGYTRPRFAFVPAVAPTQIIAPNPREFPNWSDCLLMGSMRGNTLFVLKTEGDDIVYAEPIPFNGYRLRDIVSMPDGSLAILADGGSLLLVRNAEMHRGDPQEIKITGLSSLPPPSAEEAPTSLSWMTAEERGRQYFLGVCANCHGLRGEVGIGPPLNGVIGRRIATISNFGYSTALASRRDVWTESLIEEFITNPQGVVPGTRMPPSGLEDWRAKDIVAYLKRTK